MKKLFKKTKKGFTLVELLVVIAILAVLASVSVIGYLGFVEKARVSDDNTELHQIGTLVQAQLIDGSEDVLVVPSDDTSHSNHTSESHSECKAYYVNFTYANDNVAATKEKLFDDQSDLSEISADDILAAIKAIVEVEDSAMVDNIKEAKVESGVLTIKYKNHAATESVWTLGTSETEE